LELKKKKQKETKKTPKKWERESLRNSL
jgi:hypothetical protein